MNEIITTAKVLPRMPDLASQSGFMGAKPSLANRAEQYDKSHCDAPENLLLASEFTHLDRANLIRTAKAVEELRDIFQKTARIEITNSAMHILERLPNLLDTLNKRLDGLERAISKMAKHNVVGGELAPMQDQEESA